MVKYVRKTLDFRSIIQYNTCINTKKGTQMSYKKSYNFMFISRTEALDFVRNTYETIARVQVFRSTAQTATAKRIYTRTIRQQQRNNRHIIQQYNFTAEELV